MMGLGVQGLKPYRAFSRLSGLKLKSIGSCFQKLIICKALVFEPSPCRSFQHGFPSSPLMIRELFSQYLDLRKEPGKTKDKRELLGNFISGKDPPKEALKEPPWVQGLSCSMSERQFSKNSLSTWQNP